MSTPVPSPDDDVIAAGLRDAVASAMGPEATREALGLSWEELAVGLWSEKSTLSARLAVVTRERDELAEKIARVQAVYDGVHRPDSTLLCSIRCTDLAAALAGDGDLGEPA